MNIIIWLVVGGLIGWVASIIMKTNAQQGMLLNVVVGVIGAFLGGYLIAPLLGSGTINQGDFSVVSLITSLIGAVILLAIVNLFRRGRSTGVSGGPVVR
ncbi:MAG TPA: GlsB/YeaQ/YmgE family stress response membrane protein [Verrucomicrobiae bacterium]|nr:GlsB/YeaQ/YmgE family stress response membrane protein [Verrucomicrobiae bacterium]